jgi:hypothetical protein
MDAYDLGILWATCSLVGPRYILRNADPYFAGRIQAINGGTIWQQRHARKDTVLHCLYLRRRIQEELEASGYTGRSDMSRAFPSTENDAEFARAYVQCHSALDIWKRSVKGVTRSTPRFRVHGAPDFIASMSDILALAVGVGAKKPQPHSRSEMCVLYYQDAREVRALCDWILSSEHSPKFAARVTQICD